jgi:hypothetical protein
VDENAPRGAPEPASQPTARRTQRASVVSRMRKRMANLAALAVRSAAVSKYLSLGTSSRSPDPRSTPKRSDRTKRGETPSAVPHQRSARLPRSAGPASAHAAGHSPSQLQRQQLDVLLRMDENLRRLRQSSESQRQTLAVFTEPE